jgi:TP901 family phage tail tape measure protein
MAKKFSIEAIFSARDRLSAPIAKIQGQLARLGKVGGRALKGVDGLVNKGLSAAGRASNAIGLAGVASLAGLAFEFRNVIEQGAEFEKVLVRTGTAFETPVRLGSKGFETLTAAARKVGQTTEFSALQGAEGLNSLATAGYSVEQSIAALPKIIDFASAGGLELSQASDIASDSLGAFSLRSSDAAQNAQNMARVMDSLTRAAADSTTNTAELFEGIRMGGAFAATSGASIEQFVGMLGVLANKGIKGSEAGTAIRNSFLHLAKPTQEASDTMARYGIKIAKTKAGAIDMAATIGRFSKATAKLTKVQKAAAIAAVFGAYTVGPFLSLMDAGEGTIRDFTKNLEGATGVTQKMAEAMRESAAAKIARFFNIISDVRLTVFDAIAPTVLDIASSVGKWVTANRELIGTKAAEWASTLKEALPAIAIWTERIAKAVAGLLVVATIVKTVSAIVTVAGWLSTAFAWLEATALVLGTTVGAVALPVLLIGAAIAAVVAIAWKYWPEISGFFSKLKDFAIVAVGAMWAWIATAFERAKTFVVAAFEFIVGLFSLIFAPGIEAAKWFISTLGSIFSTVVDVVKLAWAPLSEWYGTLWGGIVDTQRGYFDAIVGVWSGVLGFFTGIWQGIADGFARFVGPIIDKATSIVNTIRTVGRLAIGTADAEGGAVTSTRPGAGGVQVVSPHERAAAATADAAAAGGGSTVDGTITVKAEPGTKATVKAQPRKVPIVVQASGAFP